MYRTLHSVYVFLVILCIIVPIVMCFCRRRRRNEGRVFHAGKFLSYDFHNRKLALQYSKISQRQINEQQNYFMVPFHYHK